MSTPVDRYLKLHSDFDMLLLDHFMDMKRDDLIVLLLSTLTLEQKNAAIDVLSDKRKKKRRAPSSGASARAGTQHEEEG